eukprot:SAG31_NODE_2202_length_6200_cov_2.292083_2_plen_71_part_00
MLVGCGQLAPLEVGAACVMIERAAGGDIDQRARAHEASCAPMRALCVPCLYLLACNDTNEPACIIARVSS